MSRFQRIAICRHAQSENTFRWRWNRDRPESTPLDMLPAEGDCLSKDGLKQAVNLGQNLTVNLVRPPTAYKKVLIIHSSALRSVETANMVSDYLTKQGFQIVGIRSSPTLLELPSYDYSEEAKVKGDPIENWISTIFKDQLPSSDTALVVITHAKIMMKGLQKVLGLDEHVRVAPSVASLTMLDYEPTESHVVVHSFGDIGAKTCLAWHPADTFK